MALINCSECNKEISDRAAACPNCGAPMPTESFEREYTGPAFPLFPDKFDFGGKRINWFGESALSGVLIGSFDIEEINPGRVVVRQYKNGLKIIQGFHARIAIHYSQVISINGEATTSLGAFVETSSGYEARGIRRNFFTIEYWDLDTRQPRTLDIESDIYQIKKFVSRIRKAMKAA